MRCWSDDVVAVVYLSAAFVLSTSIGPVSSTWAPFASLDSASISSSFSPPPFPLDDAVLLFNHSLYVNSSLFFVQGIAYSPTPLGESPSGLPKGDYFTIDYAYLWYRDLPLIRAMGANTIRIYSWNTSVDHTDFLNAVYNNGLKVLITHYLGDTTVTDVSTEEKKNLSIDGFVANVKRYGDHPAILMWMFGNELNGVWNGFLTQLSQLYNCSWTAQCIQYLPTSALFNQCDPAAACVYIRLFDWINQAAKAAKAYTTRPIMTGFADVDWIVSNTPSVDKIKRYGSALADLDVYGMQLYRGVSFGDYFQQYAAEAQDKPLLVTEYGIDAYNDPCGWNENFNDQPCHNRFGDGTGGATTVPFTDQGARPQTAFQGCKNSGDQACQLPGETLQQQVDADLSVELVHNSGVNGGLAIGGFIMAWVDEYWKGESTEDECTKPCPGNDVVSCLNNLNTLGAASIYAVNQAAGCTWKAHITCGNYNLTQHDLCGYFLGAAPDHYVNEEWFGLNTPTSCAPQGELPPFNSPTVATYNLDSITMRPVLSAISSVWDGTIGKVTFPTCDTLQPCHQCTRSNSITQLKQGACDEECGLNQQAVDLNYGNAGNNGNSGNIRLSGAPPLGNGDGQTEQSGGQPAGSNNNGTTDGTSGGPIDGTANAIGNTGANTNGNPNNNGSGVNSKNGGVVIRASTSLAVTIVALFVAFVALVL